MYMVHWVEGGLDPNRHFFDPAKYCPKSAINGTPSHKQVRRLRNGGSARIKAGHNRGGFFPRPEWPSRAPYGLKMAINGPFVAISRPGGSEMVIQRGSISSFGNFWLIVSVSHMAER